MARKLGEFKGRMSIKVLGFIYAAIRYYMVRFGTNAQETIAQIIRERVEADGVQDDVALLALDYARVDKPGGE